MPVSLPPAPSFVPRFPSGCYKFYIIASRWSPPVVPTLSPGEQDAEKVVAVAARLEWGGRGLEILLQTNTPPYLRAQYYCSSLTPQKPAQGISTFSNPAAIKTKLLSKIAFPCPSHRQNFIIGSSVFIRNPSSCSHAKIFGTKKYLITFISWL